jgi:hypothetical protein
VSWTAVPGADSYEVFCGETEPGEGASPVQTVHVPEAAISGLENGIPYYVRLRAKNSAGLSGFGHRFQNLKTNASAEGSKNKLVTGISWRDVIVWCNAYSEMRELVLVGSQR